MPKIITYLVLKRSFTYTTQFLSKTHTNKFIQLYKSVHKQTLTQPYKSKVRNSSTNYQLVFLSMASLQPLAQQPRHSLCIGFKHLHWIYLKRASYLNVVRCLESPWWPLRTYAGQQQVVTDFLDSIKDLATSMNNSINNDISPLPVLFERGGVTTTFNFFFLAYFNPSTLSVLSKTVVLLSDSINLV